MKSLRLLTARIASLFRRRRAVKPAPLAQQRQPRESKVRSIEPLEGRIAPALTLVNPLGDITAGPTHTGTLVELGQMLDPTALYAGHTLVKLTLNFDTDANTAGIQPAVVTFELFDDEAPLTVANFLRYAIETDNAAAFANDLVGTYFHRGVDGFVVQGGGFTANDKLTDHITTFGTVHNEFSASRSNVAGTIAMAKVGAESGGGPHSATSEWFVNVGNNSGNLDSQNGGFTVFGKVVEGLNYFTQIAALTKVEFNGAVSTDGDAIPVQNYNADPDNNPNTPSPKPTQDQIIRITAVDVIKPQATNTAGQSFQVVNITNPLNGQPSDVVTTPTFNLSGSTLPLTYVAGKSGTADVTVRVTVNDETVTDTFRVTVQPNLIATIAGETVRDILVPGDEIKPTIKLANNGGAQFQGLVDLNFYLSPPINGDTDGRRRDADDVLIGSFDDTQITVASDGSVTLSESFKIPAVFGAADGAYRLIAEIVGDASAPTELFTDDNVAPDGNGHGYLKQFGLVTLQGFGSRIAKLSYTETDGNVVTLSITGAGNGKVSQNAGGVNIAVSGTNGASIVNLASVLSATSTSAARAQLHHIDIANTLGTLNFAQADVDGYITISSGVKVAKFGDVTGNDRTLILGAFGTLNTSAATLNFGRVTDLNIESDQPIAALTAIDWRDTNGVENRIETPVLTKLNIKGNAAAGISGDFDADVNVLRTKAVSSFVVKGFLRDSTITTPGNVGAVRIGGMIDSSFFAGTTARPDSLDDFSAKRTITSFTIAGVTGSTIFFSDSQVAASTITTLVVKGIDGASGDSAFGFVADKVLSYSSVPGKAPRLNLTKPAITDVRGNYSLTIL